MKIHKKNIKIIINVYLLLAAGFKMTVTFFGFFSTDNDKSPNLAAALQHLAIKMCVLG